MGYNLSMKTKSSLANFLLRNIPTRFIVGKAGRWLPILSLAGVCVSCSTVGQAWEESKIDDAEMKEFHADHHVFWPYANVGYAAADRGDWGTAKLMYLRAYRNTGIVLTSRGDSPLASALFGLSADAVETSKIEAYARKTGRVDTAPRHYRCYKRCT